MVRGVFGCQNARPGRTLLALRRLATGRDRHLSAAPKAEAPDPTLTCWIRERGASFVPSPRRAQYAKISQALCDCKKNLRREKAARSAVVRAGRDVPTGRDTPRAFAPALVPASPRCSFLPAFAGANVEAVERLDDYRRRRACGSTQKDAARPKAERRVHRGDETG